MGRQKQPKPLQRAPSQSMHDEAEVPQTHENGSATGPLAANGSVSSKAQAAVETVADSPGLTQLLVCVLGIYAALYVDPSKNDER